jgi:hypothetical protein
MAIKIYALLNCCMLYVCMRLGLAVRCDRLCAVMVAPEEPYGAAAGTCESEFIAVGGCCCCA